MKKSAFTVRADGRIQTKIKLPGMTKPKFIYGKTDAEVKRKLAEFRHEELRGRTMAEIVDEWQGEHFEQIAYNTMRSYLAPCKDFLSVFGKMSAGEITPQALQNFLRGYAKKGYAKRTVTNMLTVIRLAFDHAVIMGDIQISPAHVVKIPSGLPSPKRELPSDEDLQIIKDSVHLPFGLFPFFLMYTGCRPGEALAVTDKDIDRIKKSIRINKSVFFMNNKAQIKTPKTEKGNRSVVLLDRLMEQIPKFKGYLFGGEKPLDGNEYTVLWKAYKQDTGITLTPYQLRHAYATTLFEAGIDEMDAQRLMGHSNIAITKNIYTHIRQERIDTAREKLNKFIG